MSLKSIDEKLKEFGDLLSRITEKQDKFLHKNNNERYGSNEGLFSDINKAKNLIKSIRNDIEGKNK